MCRVGDDSYDADADEIAYSYAWTRNDKPVPPGKDPRVLAAGLVKKGDRFKCGVTPSDGRQKGEAGFAESTIANSAPGPTRLALQPWNPVEGKAVRCVVTVKAEDPDADSLKYRFSWLRNGQPQPFAETSDEVPARLVKAGDRWRCLVVPTDGELDGPEAGSEEVLVATPPAQGQAPPRRGSWPGTSPGGRADWGPRPSIDPALAKRL